MEDKPIIFLCGHRKGGTTMFHNLFDGHKQLSVYPVDLNVLYGYFPHYVTEEKDSEALRDRLEKVVFSDLAKVKPFTACVDVDEFRDKFYQRTDIAHFGNMAAVVSGLLMAFADLNKPSREARYHVAKETSIELYAQEISEWFPNCRFIHLMRDPRDNYAAIKSGLDKKYQGYGDSSNTLLFSVLVRNLYGMRIGEINKRLLGDHRYKIVKFEDIVANPEPEMRAICKWLDIEYDEVLTRPTICGKSTKGNSFEGRQFLGISDANIGRWKDRIEASEAAIIEFAFADVMDNYGYLREEPDGETARAVGEFYKWANRKYFYFDRFAN